MGFHEFSSPYDWSRIAAYKRTAKAAFGGMIDLSVGSPVDPVPDSVRKALAVAANDPNAYGYPATSGTADLRAAIAEWFSAARNVDLQAIHADVVPTVGSKEGVALMASLLHFGEDDVVVQPKVSYPTYEIGTQLAGAQVLKVDDVADVASWRNVPGVKAVWVNSPCNPTGEVYSAERMAGIVAAAREIGAVVLSDECYALMQWRGATNSADDDPLQSTPCALRSDVCAGSAEGVLRICKICDVPAVIAVRRDATLAGSLIDALCRAGQADDFIDPKAALPIISKKTLCVVVDTYQLGLVESKEILERCGKVAVIDHHRKGVGFIEHADLVCHEPYSSSASELVTELLQYVGDRDDKPSRVEAEGLLSGIMLDTRDFTLHTGVRTFEAAAALRRYGAETERVRQLFDVTMVEYNAKADLVEAAQMYRSCAISVSGEVPPEARVAIAQAANDLLTIQNVEASFVAVQVGNGVNISARSLGAVNVQVIMESLGGGGHQTMAAAQLKHITPEAARARIQTAIDQYRESQKKPLSKNEPESRKKEKQG